MRQGASIISRSPGSISDSRAAASLLFPEGGRPTVADLTASIDILAEISVSLVPQEAGRDPSEPIWLELLSNGLTFDIVGLAPGAPAVQPPGKEDFQGGPQAGPPMEAVVIVPGPHISGGRGMMPVLRTLAQIAGALAVASKAEAVAWHAARNRSEPDLFRKAIENWSGGGVFPGLLLTSVSVAPDKGLHSEGLALFTGQELRIEPELSGDLTKATMLALRLFDYLAERGRIDAPEFLAGPDGKPLRLTPSANGRFVRVSRG